MFAVISDPQPGLKSDPDDPAAPSIHHLEQILWINRTKPAFTVYVGDLIEGQNSGHPGLMEKQWEAFDRATLILKSPYFMVAGNHDIWDAKSDEYYRGRYGPANYSWDFGKCHFTVICRDYPAKGRFFDAGQLAWLAKDLESAAPALHRFVFVHEPLWLSNDPYLSERWMAEIHPLLVKHKVDTVFAGHEHIYAHDEIAGLRYIVAGCGGGELQYGDWPQAGSFFNFLKVAVPAKGQPAITAIRKDKESPQDIVPSGLGRTILSFTIEGYVPVAGDQPELSRAENSLLKLTQINYIQNPIDLTWEWLEPGGGPAQQVEPAKAELKLMPGERRTTAFKIAPRQAPLLLKKSLTAAGQTLYSDEFILTPVRSGRYSSSASKAAPLAVAEPRQVVRGLEKWSGTNDCSAVCEVIREDKGLRFKATVRDDVVKSGAKVLSQNDLLDFYLDFRPSEKLGSEFYERGVFRVIVAPNRDSPNGAEISFTAKGGILPVPGYEVKAEIVNNAGYKVELYLPFEGLAQERLAPGEGFNFNLGIHDVDAEARESVLMWSGDDKNHVRASGFGRLKPYK